MVKLLDLDDDGSSSDPFAETAPERFPGAPGQVGGVEASAARAVE
jgi:hypothetical protein